MFAQLNVFRTARAMAIHAGRRQAIIAQNIANADTPGYRAHDIAPFAETYKSAGFSHAMKATRPDHLNGNTTGQDRARVVERPGEHKPNHNTVSIEQEMMLAAEVRLQHEQALAIYKTSLGILRASLGRF